MHSSRMRTASSLPYGRRGLPDSDPPDRDPLDRDPLLWTSQAPVKTLLSQTSFACGNKIRSINVVLYIDLRYLLCYTLKRTISIARCCRVSRKLIQRPKHRERLTISNYCRCRLYIHQTIQR